MKLKKLSTEKLLAWLDNNLLTLLAGFLLVFIPLYPKLPLFDILPGYIVRVRLEDFVIFSTIVVWLVQIKRRKIVWKNPLTGLIKAYLFFGLLSTLSALFITKTVLLEPLHAGKMYLHYLRYIEYFSLFFIFYSAIRTKIQAKTFLILTPITMLVISLYGYGQKYLYWPVYSTMNREFAKGWKLYLTEHARVPSTFGGHYDLAAYTMMILTIVIVLFFLTKNKILKSLFGVTFLMAFWLLILTASRTSFISYLVAISASMGVLFFVKNWLWSIPRWFGIMLFSMVVMLSFGDLSERFTQILGLDKIREKYSNLAFLPKKEKPADYESVNEISLVTDPSDTPPIPEKPGNGDGAGGGSEGSGGNQSASPSSSLPPDVYEDIPLPVKSDKGGTELVSRTYSDNAYKFGLSAAIRFDKLWPQARAGFYKNPLLGSGYSTLTKEGVGEFTEAESTDNNFLRTLGETGLLGFFTFYGIIFYFLYLVIIHLKQLKTEPLFLAFAVGMIGATLGLLLNAVYIDVFAASKVAEFYWALVGLQLAIIYELSPREKRAIDKK